MYTFIFSAALLKRQKIIVDLYDLFSSKKIGKVEIIIESIFRKA